MADVYNNAFPRTNAETVIMTTTANKTDFCWYRGDTFAFTVIWQDDAGNPIDLTGHTVRFQVRSKPGVGVAFVDLSVGTGITLVELDGEIIVNVDSTNTGTNCDTLRKAAYDLEVTSPGGTVTTLIYGDIDFITDVSR